MCRVTRENSLPFMPANPHASCTRMYIFLGSASDGELLNEDITGKIMFLHSICVATIVENDETYEVDSTAVS
jgi:hypothetical protein